MDLILVHFKYFAILNTNISQKICLLGNSNTAKLQKIVTKPLKQTHTS